jgi:hypothetical protein
MSPSAATPPALILARLDALGAANVARLVAPAWGYRNPDQALERLSRYRAHLEGRGGRDMPSSALFALLPVLGLAVEEIGWWTWYHESRGAQLPPESVFNAFFSSRARSRAMR